MSRATKASANAAPKAEQRKADGPSSSPKKKEGVSTGVIVATVLTMGGLLGGVVWFVTRKKDSVVTDPLLPPPPSSASTSTAPGKTPTALPSASNALPAGTFPIKWGQKSVLVQNVQKALIAGGGTAASIINSSGGADGIYGNATQSALAQKGLPSTIDEATYNVIVKGSSPSSATATVSPAAIRTALISAEASKSATAVENVLKLIKTPQQYADVQYNLIGGNGIVFSGDLVKKTIVTKLLETFFTEPDRSRIEGEFFRIGLIRNSNGTWSLPSGISGMPLGKDVVTNKAIAIRDKNSLVAMIVEPNTILGQEISRDKDGMSTIMTRDGKMIVAPSEFLYHIN